MECMLVDASTEDGTCSQITSFLSSRLKKLNFEVATFRLKDMEVGACLGCYSSVPSSCVHPCVVKDDCSAILEQASECDCMVFVTPTYWSSVPGKLKNLVDRLTSLENNGYL
ncbi:MAG: NAD(P)H-dependent oxidoreductase, partial [Thermoprotei archaeon]